MEGAKAVGPSGHHSNLVVEAFDSPAGDLAFGPEPIKEQFPVITQSPSNPLHGFEAAAHDQGAPAIQKGPGPPMGFVAPEVLEGLLEVPGPSGGQLTGEQRIELAAGMTSDP